MDASRHPRTVCPGPGMLRRWQSASVLGFGKKRPTALPNVAVAIYGHACRARLADAAPWVYGRVQ